MSLIDSKSKSSYIYDSSWSWYEPSSCSCFTTLLCLSANQVNVASRSDVLNASSLKKLHSSSASMDVCASIGQKNAMIFLMLFGWPSTWPVWPWGLSSRLFFCPCIFCSEYPGCYLIILLWRWVMRLIKIILFMFINAFLKSTSRI